MWSLLMIGIGLGLVDCLNPFTISTQVVLQPFVKKPTHTFYYIAGTYMSYLLGGVLIYYGIDKLIKAFGDDLMASYSTVLFLLKFCLVLGCLYLDSSSFSDVYERKEALKKKKSQMRKKYPRLSL